MKTIKLNNDIEINLDKLIESRLLIQANSGGGKSWAIRRVIEQSFGKVQIIVIDPEGEFTNLRQKYDFVYAGKGGDAPVESRSAQLLAKRLLELKASAVIDLYELHPQERKKFVRLFLDSMVNAPKELWYDCLVIIDEAHVFAPEKGESEAMGPLIDLATRGRKRGYCVVLATQRLPKLHKDASAECNNKLIGRASQDIDRKRASEELGFTSAEQVRSLRNLEPGEFYVFGPAISNEVIKMKIGEVKVKPPLRGESKNIIPSPTEKVKKILSQLADIPKEAQEELNTISELKAKVRNLEHEQRSIRPQSQSTDPKVIEKSVTQAIKETERRMNVQFMAERDEFIKHINTMFKVITTVGNVVKDIKMPDIKARKVATKAYIESFIEPLKTINRLENKRTNDDLNTGITNPERRILNAIAWMNSIGIEAPNNTAVAFLADYTVGGGGYNNPKGSLRSKGLIEYQGDQLILTEAGRELAEIPDQPLDTSALHNKVLARLPNPEVRLLIPLLNAYPNEMSNDELAEASGYVVGSGGFNNPKGRLRTLGLIEYIPGGRVKASSLLFI